MAALTPAPLVVCFTGFAREEHDELANLAYAAKHHITAAVTRQLTLLVVGRDANSDMLTQATERGIRLMTGDQYRTLLRARRLDPS